MLTDTSVDTLNPQGTEITFVDLAIAVGVLTGFFNRLTRYFNLCAASAPIAFGGFEDFFVFGVTGDASFYT